MLTSTNGDRGLNNANLTNPAPNAASQFRVGDVVATGLLLGGGRSQLNVTFPNGTISGDETIIYTESATPEDRITDEDGFEVRSPDSRGLKQWPVVDITDPSNAAPATVAAGQQFTITFSTDVAGDYRLAYRVSDPQGTFVRFTDGTGDAMVGSNTVTVTVPADTPAGTYDLRAQVVSPEGPTGQGLEFSALIVE